jgi:hypothetical protein
MYFSHATLTGQTGRKALWLIAVGFVQEIVVCRAELKKSLLFFMVILYLKYLL